MTEDITFDGLVTPAAAYQRFLDDGESIAAWAIMRGFNPALVYSVLRGERKCIRGQSHKIAVSLGIKATKRELNPQGAATPACPSGDDHVATTESEAVMQ